jgi:hypothetical protein
MNLYLKIVHSDDDDDHAREKRRANERKIESSLVRMKLKRFMTDDVPLSSRTVVLKTVLFFE